MTFKDLKGTAREKLCENYSVIIMGTIMASLITLVVTSIFTPNAATMNTWQIVIYYLADFLITILGALLSAGVTKMILSLMRQERPLPNMLFYAFKDQPDRYIITLFIMTALVAIPYIITISYESFAADTSVNFYITDAILYIITAVVAIIMNLEMAFAIPLLIDNPDYTAKDAITKSMELMKGKKGKLFVLYLSFTGYIILGLLSFGIGLLWVGPYIQGTVALFYLDAIGDFPVK